MKHLYSARASRLGPGLTSEGSHGMFTGGRIVNRLKALRDDGATAVEYAIMLAGIALLVVAAAFAIGPILVKWFSDVVTGLAG